MFIWCRVCEMIIEQNNSSISPTKNILRLWIIPQRNWELRNIEIETQINIDTNINVNVNQKIKVMIKNQKQIENVNKIK